MQIILRNICKKVCTFLIEEEGYISIKTKNLRLDAEHQDNQ